MPLLLHFHPILHVNKVIVYFFCFFLFGSELLFCEELDKTRIIFKKHSIIRSQSSKDSLEKMLINWRVTHTHDKASCYVPV